LKGKEIIQKARAEGRILLSEIESKELIKQAGINVIDSKLARSKKDALCISDQMGYPVVLKISSQEITHKSDAGGVKLGLTSREEVVRAYEDILRSVTQMYPKAVIQGVTVQKAAKPGVEVIVGMSKDAQFGPVLMFGLGGIFVEILKDVSFRIVPLTRKDAASLIREIKGYPLLEGYRGAPAVDVQSLEDLLLKLSGFVLEYPEIKELDLNPIFAYSNGNLAVDARIILES
jgi:acyl-CoA synthetase (NDP forming)